LFRDVKELKGLTKLQRNEHDTLRQEMREQGVTRRAYKKLQATQTTVINNRLTSLTKAITDPDWKTTLETKNKALEEIILKQKGALVNNQLHMTRMEREFKALNTKVDSMFTPLRDTFEYQHIIQQFDEQHNADTTTALFNAKQRADIVATQLTETKKLTSRYQEVFNMALANSPPPDNTLRSTIADLASRLTKLEGAPPSNTTISQSDTSRTRTNSRTTASALTDTDTTGRTTTAPSRRDRPSRRDTTRHSSRDRHRSRSRSPQRYSPPAKWDPPLNPTADYSAVPIQPAEILQWSETSLRTREKPSARYLMRIYEVPRAMVEHNNRSTSFTVNWRHHRNTQLKSMLGHLPHHLSTHQQSILSVLSTHLRTTSHLELGYSLAHHSKSTTPQNIWPVTCPLCDPSSHQQKNDISHFDFHLPLQLRKIRNCSPRRISNDNITHRPENLEASENMLNAQDLHTHIRRYSNDCFLHAAYELILDTLYPHLQRQMTEWRNPSIMYFPPATTVTHNYSRKRTSKAIDVDVDVDAVAD